MAAPQLADTTGAKLVVQSVRAVRHFGVVVGVVAAGCTACDTGRGQRRVDYAEARAVVNRRCIECHSEKPTSRAYPFAPKGVMLDTALQMKQHAARIKGSATVERTMPLANMSGMTDEERWALGRWVDMGAKIP